MALTGVALSLLVAWLRRRRLLDSLDGPAPSSGHLIAHPGR
ncbi:hypothetical protein Vqi01_19600 [Micromonospora qiuiae]|uniref:Uncharacterized protein n=1 Tax=Micromonospora qiuiae TaxID=502268 RepID=A0ABQ4J9F0_9ACTN|nr:hypothetical protein Vqi01_19600 [Micromonospora qiuiae]